MCFKRNFPLDGAMLDLGAFVNVMPRFVYDKLNLEELKKTSLIVQLTDTSNAHPNRVLEDALIQVNELNILLIFMYWTWMMHAMTC